MANDNKYIPALRFPEFQNDGEWGLASVGIYYKVQGGFAFKSGEFKDSGIPIVRISNIPNDVNYVDTNNCVYYDRIPNEKSFLIAKGDLLIAMSGATTGKTAVYNKDNEAYLNQRVGLFKSINSQNYYPFICQWVKTELFQNQLKRTLAAGAQPNISSKDIESFTLIYPISDNSSNEQKKIADCLSSLDSYIDATKRKLELLKEHKKGLMQRLFPAKGKTTPELRFPEFQNDGEWIPRPLSDILNYEQPTPYIVEDDTYKKEGTPVLTANKGFILGYTDESFGIYSKLPVIIFDDFTTDKKYVDFSFKIKSSAIKLLTLKDEERDNLRFIFECMSNIVFEEKEHKRYYISEYQHINIYVPSSLQEQNQIADTLLSVDKQISEYDKKIKALELHKKGLMQQLFPKL